MESVSVEVMRLEELGPELLLTTEKVKSLRGLFVHFLEVLGVCCSYFLLAIRLGNQ